jgi:uncharacterized membrane protein
MTRRLGPVALVAVLVLGAVAAAPALAAASAVTPESAGEPAANAGLASQTAPGPVPQATPDGFDSTVFRVTAYENGSARWTLQYLRLLENESQVATFEEYAAEFERTEPAFVRDFRTRAERLTAFGTNATGRTMTATGFRRAAFVRTQPGGTQAVGVVELSFLWSGFAQVREDRVVVSDVFAHGRNLSFAADGVDPEPDSVAGGALGASDTVTWVGERRFLDARPRVAYARVEAGAEPPGEETTTSGSDGSGVNGGAGSDGPGDPNGSSPNDGGSGLMLPVALGVVLLLGLGGLAWYSGAIPAGRASGTDGETGSPGDAGGTSAGTARAQTRDPAASPPVSEAELLSDEDRVRRLLEDNGGRMKQVDIVDETEWSKSKVSMLLSEMEDDGEISKLRVGRENIISLSGHEPEAAGSPFDEE